MPFHYAGYVSRDWESEKKKDNREWYEEKEFFPYCFLRLLLFEFNVDKLCGSFAFHKYSIAYNGSSNI